MSSSSWQSSVEGVAVGQVHPSVEAVERVRRLDAHLPERLLVGPVLDDHGDVGHLLPEGARELSKGRTHQLLELSAGHSGPGPRR